MPGADPPPPGGKAALRARMRAERDRFVLAGAPPLPVPVPFLARLRPGLVVAAYAPMGSEADPAPLVAAARAAGCRLALPHVTTRAAPLRFLEWADGAALEPGPFGLGNPRADWAEVTPDLILAPLLAFDGTLNRLGQGAGHYDRAFGLFPDAWRLGVAWSVQRVAAALPADDWDVPLHAVMTEDGWWTR